MCFGLCEHREHYNSVLSVYKCYVWMLRLTTNENIAETQTMLTVVKRRKCVKIKPEEIVKQYVINLSPEAFGKKKKPIENVLCFHTLLWNLCVLYVVCV